MFAYIALDYTFWAVKLVEQFCSHLNIKCFSIPYKTIKDSTTPKKKTKEQVLKTPVKSVDEFNSPRRITRSLAKKLE